MSPGDDRMPRSLLPQAGKGELPDQLVQVVAAVGPASNERLVGQRGEHAQRRVGDALRGVAREPADEDPQPRERFPLFVAQQVPRAGDNRLETPVSMRAVAMCADEGARLCFDRGGQVGARNRAHPRCGKLDAQRQALDETADAQHVRHFRRQRETQVRLPRALRKELDRGDRRRGLRTGFLGRIREPAHLVDPLLLQAQHFTRRDDQPDLGRGLQDLQDERDRIGIGWRVAVEQRLEVVQHQQPFLSCEHLHDRICAIATRGRVAAQRLRNGLRQCIRGFAGLERHPGNALRKAGSDLRGERMCQTRLAGAAQPVQRDQPAPRIGEQPFELRELVEPADERGPGDGRSVQRCGRIGVPRSIGRDTRIRRSRPRERRLLQRARLRRGRTAVRHRQEPLTQLILRERGVAPAHVDVEPHQPPVCRFGARHQRRPAQADGECGLPLAGGARRIVSRPVDPPNDDAVENGLRELRESHALGMQPIVELGRGGRLEVLQQLILVQRGRRFETVEVLATRERFEALHVDERRGRRRTSDRFAIDGQARGHRRRQPMQRGTQTRPRRFVVAMAPEQRGQLMARMALSSQQKKAEERQRLLRRARHRGRRNAQLRLS